jgi:hypothetical protein
VAAKVTTTPSEFSCPFCRTTLGTEKTKHCLKCGLDWRESISEQEWLECTSPERLLYNLTYKLRHPQLVRPSKRKLRLLACALSRFLLAYQMTPEISNAIASAESTDDNIAHEYTLSLDSHHPAARLPKLIIGWLSLTGFVTRMSIDARLRSVIEDELGCNKSRLEVGEEPSRLVRDVFGNPFRPVLFDPAWVTSNVLSLARTAYEETSFDKLPLLANALEEVGCTTSDFLAHCREPGPHVRGCWVVDLVLGKQ